MKRHTSTFPDTKTTCILILATLIGAISGNLHPAKADPSTGIVISRSGDKVNVSYNPSALPYFDIYRKDDAKTIIRASHGHNSDDFRLVIDPRLKKDNIVQETETPRGKVITINSQQVYMVSQEDLGEVSLDKGDKPGNKLSTASKTGAASKKTALQPASKPLSTLATISKSAPAQQTTAKPANGQPTPPKTASTQSTATKPVNGSAVPIKPALGDTPPSLASKPIPNKASSLVKPTNTAANSKQNTDEAIQSLPNIQNLTRPASVHTPANTAEPGKKPVVTTESKPAQPKSPKMLTPRSPVSPTGRPVSAASGTSANIPSEMDDSKNLRTASKVATPASQPVTGIAKTDDPESLPLDLSGHEQEAARQTSTGMMLRVTIGLVIVLVLLLGFMKLLLPKLMARYPDFFENLKRRHQPELSLNAGMQDDGERPERNTILGLPRVERATGVPLKRKGLKAPVLTGSESPNMTKHSDKKHYLERLGLGGAHFNVITSAQLGKGKELHLVEIQGRQLVVATTPYSISLIKDLTDTDLQAPGEFESGADPMMISGLLASGSPDDAPTTGESIETDDYYNPGQPKTHAYLEDEPLIRESDTRHPARQEVRRKPYASVASSTATRSRSTATEHPPQMETTSMPHESVRERKTDPLDSIYLKYLSPEEMTDSRQQALSQKRSIENFLENNPYQHSYHYGATVDAEDVVVLEDYDDTYEG